MLYPPELRAQSIQIVVVVHGCQTSRTRAPAARSSSCRPAEALDHTTVADSRPHARSNGPAQFFPRDANAYLVPRRSRSVVQTEVR